MAVVCGTYSRLHTLLEGRRWPGLADHCIPLCHQRACLRKHPAFPCGRILQWTICSCGHCVFLKVSQNTAWRNPWTWATPPPLVPCNEDGAEVLAYKTMWSSPMKTAIQNNQDTLYPIKILLEFTIACFCLYLRFVLIKTFPLSVRE